MCLLPKKAQGIGGMFYECRGRRRSLHGECFYLSLWGENLESLKDVTITQNREIYLVVKGQGYLCSAKKKWLMSFFILTKYMGVEGGPSSWLVK